MGPTFVELLFKALTYHYCGRLFGELGSAWIAASHTRMGQEFCVELYTALGPCFTARLFGTMGNGFTAQVHQGFGTAFTSRLYEGVEMKVMALEPRTWRWLCAGGPARCFAFLF